MLGYLYYFKYLYSKNLKVAMLEHAGKDEIAGYAAQ